MKAIVAGAVLGAVFLTGCATGERLWRHAEYTKTMNDAEYERAFKQDYFECRVAVRSGGGAVGSPAFSHQPSSDPGQSFMRGYAMSAAIAAAQEETRLMEMCMEARGWREVTAREE